ncbi:hypothetical protein CLHUN_17670 [Ruminiclostridium hungatei]|uniref:tRNA(Glu)-specific nuclease WapA n=2 Tax=Ruminiclostridium hungatei TaxID=48256 RepID=A0A1V4SKA7_RUMHU|nr:hypothetical protein CLHUN_17670 [Ruminiclostridium hungatei]
MYDAKTARFMQEDTYTGNAGDPLSLNLYTYCHNEPVMYSDPTGHFEKTDELIKDQATLGLLEIYGKNWDTYNKKANEYKNNDKELYDFYISLRNEQHDKAEATRADYVVDNGKYAYDYAKEKLGEAKANYILAVENYYSDNKGMAKEQVYRAMNVKQTNDITFNEQLLFNAQQQARNGLDKILMQKINKSNPWDISFNSFSFGTEYYNKSYNANTSNSVWQTFAFIGGMFLDKNNPSNSGPDIADKRSQIIIDYTSQGLSGLLIDGGEPGGMEFLNIIDPFQHARNANKAEMISNFVNQSEYKYLIDAEQGSTITKKFITKVDEYRKVVEKREYKYGDDKQSRIYKKLILEYINIVINENKNHDATVKKFNSQLRKCLIKDRKGNFMHSKSKKTIYCIFILILIIFTQSACESKYKEFDSAFMLDYYKIIQDIDSEKVDDILFKLQSKENTEILDNMNNLLEDNKELRKKNEKRYDELQELYTGLIDLKDAYKKWESYDFDRQQYLNTQLNNIYVYLSLLESDKEGNTK